MKYRIREENNKFRAEIYKDNYWLEIENDNERCVYLKRFFNTIEEAEEACRKHHIEKGYNNIGKDIVKEFELK